MNAVEFLKEERRMCESFEQGCLKCLLRDTSCRAIPGETDEDIEKEVALVEQWSKEHPGKTRQSVFLKQWPDAIISQDGLPQVAPCQLCVGLIHGKSTEDCEKRGLCAKCRREFWMQEVE